MAKRSGSKTFKVDMGPLGPRGEQKIARLGPISAPNESGQTDEEFDGYLGSLTDGGRTQSAARRTITPGAARRKSLKKAANKALKNVVKRLKGYDAGKVSAVYELMMANKEMLASQARMRKTSKHIGFVKPDSLVMIGNELQAETWNGYAISIVVVVDKMRRG